VWPAHAGQAAGGAGEAGVGVQMHVLAGACAWLSQHAVGPRRELGPEVKQKKGRGVPGLCRVHVDALDSVRPLEERALQGSTVTQFYRRAFLEECIRIHGITRSAQAATTTSTDRRTLTSRRSGCTWHTSSSSNQRQYCSYVSCTTGNWMRSARGRGGGGESRCQMRTMSAPSQ